MTSDDNKNIISEFEAVRDQYNKDLKDLRDKYEPKFKEILEGASDGKISSGDAN